MRLTFKDSYDNERELGNFETEAQAYKCISEFLKEHNYKSYYTRVSHFPEYDLIDVGSWSEFFHLYKETGDAK